MNINVSSKSVVRDHQCISCLECTSEAKCPVAGTVTFSTCKITTDDQSGNKISNGANS